MFLNKFCDMVLDGIKLYIENTVLRSLEDIRREIEQHNVINSRRQAELKAKLEELERQMKRVEEAIINNGS